MTVLAVKASITIATKSAVRILIRDFIIDEVYMQQPGRANVIRFGGIGPV
jgi:hypothetical protein